MNTIVVTADKAMSMLDRAAKIISEGGLVVFPTETVYGLGADATNPLAAKRIYSAKGRPSDNPLIIHISEPRDAEKYTYTTETFYKLAKEFMPGPLTVVMKSKDTIPPETRGGLNTVAIRCPEHPVARELIKLSGVPIAAPSANISGSPSPTVLAHVIDDMYGRVEMIIDGGACDIGVESTIVKIEEDESVVLLRPGKITVSDIERVVGKIAVSKAVLDKLNEGQVAESPGMKYRHYAPKSPLFLLDGTPEKVVEYSMSLKTDNIALIVYNEDYDFYSGKLDNMKLYKLGNRDNQDEHAHALFYILREIDKKSYDMILAPLPSKNGLGLAIYNRMIRASAYQVIKL